MCDLFHLSLFLYVFPDVDESSSYIMLNLFTAINEFTLIDGIALNNMAYTSIGNIDSSIGMYFSWIENIVIKYDDVIAWVLFVIRIARSDCEYYTDCS